MQRMTQNDLKHDLFDNKDNSSKYIVMYDNCAN